VRHFNAASFMQFIKNLATFSYIKSTFNFFLPIFETGLRESQAYDLALEG
jgi:hypothetical protein